MKERDMERDGGRIRDRGRERSCGRDIRRWDTVATIYKMNISNK